jgi:hypothetical protein
MPLRIKFNGSGLINPKWRKIVVGSAGIISL